MKVETRTAILKLTEKDSRLEVYVVVNGVELSNPNTVCSGPTADVEDFAKGIISWDELSVRWAPKKR